MKYKAKKIKINCVFVISIYTYEDNIAEYYNPYKMEWKWFAGFIETEYGRDICTTKDFAQTLRYNSLYVAKCQLNNFLANGIKAVIVEIPKEILYSDAIERRQY